MDVVNVLLYSMSMDVVENEIGEVAVLILIRNSKNKKKRPIGRDSRESEIVI